MNAFNPIIEVEDDGLNIDKVRQWSSEKYRLVGRYCDIFTKGMQYQWNQLVYIDLFAGSGYASIDRTDRILKNSALIALSIPTPFTKYILCEKDSQRFNALKERVERDFSQHNVTLLNVDSNTSPDEINCALPSFSRGNTRLSFCFVDPYSVDLNFSTIQTLGNCQTDFLILQALHMDANRNMDIYLCENNTTIATYLGNQDWRELYLKSKRHYARDFVKFLADQYRAQMVKMGYIDKECYIRIKSDVKNLPLYYLTFFSKDKTGIDFFQKMKHVVHPEFQFQD